MSKGPGVNFVIMNLTTKVPLPQTPKEEEEEGEGEEEGEEEAPIRTVIDMPPTQTARSSRAKEFVRRSYPTRQGLKFSFRN